MKNKQNTHIQGKHSQNKLKKKNIKVKIHYFIEEKRDQKRHQNLIKVEKS